MNYTNHEQKYQINSLEILTTDMETFNYKGGLYVKGETSSLNCSDFINIEDVKDYKNCLMIHPIITDLQTISKVDGKYVIYTYYCFFNDNKPYVDILDLKIKSDKKDAMHIFEDEEKKQYTCVVERHLTLTETQAYINECNTVLEHGISKDYFITFITEYGAYTPKGCKCIFAFVSGDNNMMFYHFDATYNNKTQEIVYVYDIKQNKTFLLDSLNGTGLKSEEKYLCSYMQHFVRLTFEQFGK